MTSVDFYFDYLSPFAYLASLQIGELCRQAGAAPVFRPILFAAVLDHWGQRGPAEIPPKALHTFKECLRYAVLRGLPFRVPRLHPWNPLLSLRTTWAAEDDAERARIARALFELGWARGGDLCSEAEIAAQLSAAGLPAAELLARAQTTDVKQRLRSETERAIERGVFGVPTMLAGTELFWGVSQLDNLTLYLSGRDPLAGREPSEYIPEGSGARRK